VKAHVNDKHSCKYRGGLHYILKGKPVFDVWENGDFMKWDCKDRMMDQEGISENQNKTSEII